MAKLTKFEKEVMSAEHKYFKVKTDIYGYKIMLKSSGVKKFIKNDKTKPVDRIDFCDLPVNDYVMVKYRIPRGADIYVSGVDTSMHKKCRASEVEIVEIREIIEEENGEIHTGKQYNGYGYSLYVIINASRSNKSIISACSKPSSYGRCKKGQKFIMKHFFHLTPGDIDRKLSSSEGVPPWYRIWYAKLDVTLRIAHCESEATCNKGFHFFMEKTEAINYLLHSIFMRC